MTIKVIAAETLMSLCGILDFINCVGNYLFFGRLRRIAVGVAKDFSHEELIACQYKTPTLVFRDLSTSVRTNTRVNRF